ncbi:MAG: copper chaperone PCu(A)C [Betaproteobacteria bacterium]
MHPSTSQGIHVKSLVLLAALSCSLAAHAEVKVSDAWVRGTVAAQKSTGAFMTLSSDQPVSLVAVSSPAARIVEVHEMKMDNHVMMMQAVPRLDIVPGKPVQLKPGGYHVMLIDLVKPLSKGGTVALMLEFKGADGKSSRQAVTAEVRDLTAAAHAQQ